MLVCQGSGQRPLHDPLQFPEVGDVLSQQVVLDDAPELRLIPADDGVVIVVQEFGTVCRFTFAHVSATVLFDDFGGDSQADDAVDCPPPVAVELVV